MKKIDRLPLRIVGDLDATAPQPSRALGEHGSRLWERITREYVIEDASGVEMLTQICQACDRAEALAADVREDGEVIRGPNGLRSHPAIREEMACRGFIIRRFKKWA